jgi:integrase
MKDRIMPKPKKRFTNLKNHTGIRKDNHSNKYVATICIDGKRKTKTLDTLKAAIKWRREFSEDILIQESPTSMTFKEAWQRFSCEYVSSLQTSTKNTYKKREKIFKVLNHLEMHSINPSVISKFLTEEKKKCVALNNTRRSDFDHELKLLGTFFNWYKEFIDYSYQVPILKRHKQIGKIREKTIRNKKMSYEQIKQFLEALQTEPFWYEFVLTQFYLAARVSEVAGLQVESIDLDNRSILIKDVTVWGDDKRFLELKNVPKNNEIRKLYINDDLFLIFKSKLKTVKNGFVFQIDEKPLDYRVIQYHYNKALKACGLYPEFSGTHIMRHSMATLARRVTQSLELTQAMTGHRDQKMVQHYAAMDLEANREAQEKILDFINSEKSEQREQMRTNSLYH